MAHADLRKAVFDANILLARSGLVVLTFGNVSGVDREAGVMAIKPSGVDYDAMKPADIPVVSLESGEVVDGSLKPSSDTPTHLALYRELGPIGAVVHSHSAFATSWAQGGKEIPCFGTTHADFCSACIPVTRQLSPAEIMRDYEANTGRVIIETLRKNKLTPSDTPGVLVTGHGPFVWGADARKAVENAIILEEIARIAYQTLIINPRAERLPRTLHEKHFQRKHGPDAYYGQKQ
jgi:L-ribulose-5-phosphate 4-epimerase